MATIGFLWVWAAFQLKDQARVLQATVFLTLGFILSRILGLFLDVLIKPSRISNWDLKWLP